MLQTPGRAHDANVRYARDAARKAVQAHIQEISRENSKTPRNALALYTWGGLAGLCWLAAIATAVIPFAMDPAYQTVKTEDRIVEDPDLPPVSLQVELNAIDVTSDDDETTVIANLPRPQNTAPLSQQERAQYGLKEGLTLDETTTSAISNPSPEIRSDQKQETPLPEVNQPMEDLPVDTQTAAVAVNGDLAARILLPSTRAAPEAIYAALQRRAPKLFVGLSHQPFEGTTATQFTVGPFSSPLEQARFCRAVKLRLTLDCAPAIF